MVSYTLLRADGSTEKVKATEVTKVVVSVWTEKAIKANPWPFVRKPKVGDVYTIWWAWGDDVEKGAAQCRASMAASAADGPRSSWQQYLTTEIRTVELRGRTRTIKMF